MKDTHSYSMMTKVFLCSRFSMIVLSFFPRLEKLYRSCFPSNGNVMDLAPTSRAFWRMTLTDFLTAELTWSFSSHRGMIAWNTIFQGVEDLCYFNNFTDLTVPNSKPSGCSWISRYIYFRYHLPNNFYIC